MFKSLLVANRGEVASRIIRAARSLDVRTVAVYSEADADLPFVDEADEALYLGGGPAHQSYLDADVMLDLLKKSGAEALHPGYGFFAENPDFAERVLATGVTWVGPTPDLMRVMADKIRARNAMAREGLSIASGTTDPIDSAAQARTGAEAIGYPVMLKAAAGGGGLGMATARSAEEMAPAFKRVQSAAARLFGDGRVLFERYIERARHVEVQVLGLNDGRVVGLGLRECSVQRRHQKIVEEAPAPGLPPDLTQRLRSDAIRAVAALEYRGLGTVECLVDVERMDYVFIEMNTRLQVEHPITEMTTGVDLVAEQLHVAGGSRPTFEPDIVRTSGHAIEFRICAEDPVRWLPSAGTLTAWEMPQNPRVRVDASYRCGNTVTPHYDSLLAKLCVWGRDRSEALARARTALDETRIDGIRTNLPLLRQVTANDDFVAGAYTTDILERMKNATDARKDGRDEQRGEG